MKGHEMPHEVEQMAYFGETPWHGLGVKVDGLMTAEEAIVAAGLDWDIELEPISTKYGVVPGRFATVRSTDKTTKGIVGSDYKPIQNRQAFSFFDGIVDSGEAKYETAGSLADGRRVWLTAQLGDTMTVCGEEHKLYLLISSSHDGSRAFTAATTMVRVVCANTETMALKGAKTKWSINHKRTLEGRMGEARTALQLAFKGAEAFELEVAKLMDISVDKDQFVGIVSDILPQHQKRQLPKNIETLTRIFESEPTIVDTEANGNAWGAYNAMTYFMDHEREVRSLEARMTSLMDGFGAQMRNKMHERLLALV